MNNIKEVNAFEKQKEHDDIEGKVEFTLGTYDYYDSFDSPYYDELGLRVMLTDNEDLLIKELKDILSVIIEDIEDLRYTEENSYEPKSSEDEEELRLFEFEYKKNGVWSVDRGLYVSEYFKYENDSKEFKDLVNKGIIKIV
ncbi:hypothetical protein [Clostridium perfringens]|uniref:hypothetical protein n=1 Tax=Clostridium perfringens TaxID=1502 RepID=UPI0024BC3759|nr:hypothetical protein [Clostridium perfringens]